MTLTVTLVAKNYTVSPVRGDAGRRTSNEPQSVSAIKSNRGEGRADLAHVGDQR
jgi:hypothetical protein